MSHGSSSSSYNVEYYFLRLRHLCSNVLPDVRVLLRRDGFLRWRRRRRAHSYCSSELARTYTGSERAGRRRSDGKTRLADGRTDGERTFYTSVHIGAAGETHRANSHCLGLLTLRLFYLPSKPANINQSVFSFSPLTAHCSSLECPHLASNWLRVP